MDGKPVENQLALRDMIAEKGPDAEARFKIVRGGRTLTVSAKLATHPEDVKNAACAWQGGNSPPDAAR
jgi:S1-C subfamily serine protease